MSEIAISVALTSFLSGACLFFMGLLLSAETDAARSRAALGMLFVAALGFLFSTLIYANASGEVVRLRTTSFTRQMAIGNALSEYLGVFPLVFASPLAVLAFTDDTSLAVFFLCAASSGVVLYHESGFGIITRNLAKPLMRVITGAMIVGAAAQFAAVQTGRDVEADVLTVTVLAGLGGLMMMGLRRGEAPSDITIGPARPAELGVLSDMDRQAFAGDEDQDPYGPITFRQLYDLFPDLILIARSRNADPLGYIAAGTTTRGQSAWILSVVVHDALQGQGIGAFLVGRALDRLTSLGVESIRATVRPDNVRARRLFESAGFVHVATDPDYFGATAARVIMEWRR